MLKLFDVMNKHECQSMQSLNDVFFMSCTHNDYVNSGDTNISSLSNAISNNAGI